jgi:hypothetical protein
MHLARRATTSLSPKKVMMNPLPRMATGLGAMISLSPQRQLAAYIIQDNDEPLATKGLRATYAVQGNNKPLATIGDWATTFDDHEGAKTSTVKLITPIAILHHCNEAPQRLQLSLSLSDRHCNKCVGHRFFHCHCEKQHQQGCTTRKPRLFIAEAITKHCVHTSPSRTHRSCQ